MYVTKSHVHCVQHRNSSFSTYFTSKLWFWFLTPQSHPRSNLTVPVESPWLLSKKSTLASNLVSVTVFKIFRIKALWPWPLTSSSSKVKPMGTLYNLRRVQHRNSCRSWHISRQKVWPWFLTPQGHPRSNLMVPIESPWTLSYMNFHRLATNHPRDLDHPTSQPTKDIVTTCVLRWPPSAIRDHKALKKTSWSSKSGLNSIRTTPPCYNTTLGNRLYAQRKGPNVTNPICWTYKNCSHKCAADCEHCVTQSSTELFW